MTRQPFTSRDEVADYLADDLIECLQCGRRLRTLGQHLRRAHGMSCADYRAAWQLPAGTPLAGRTYRAERSALAHRLVAAGVIGQGAAVASEVAREAGRGTRAPWEITEQAERASRIPHDQLPPGARRADGRDADNAREYQRRRRATDD